MPASRVSVVCPMFFVDDKREAFVDEWCFFCASGKLDGAVLDFHLYFFGSWANEQDHGSVCEQVEREAAEIGVSVPSSVVGEWSVAFMTEMDEPCQDIGRMQQFLQVQQEAYATHVTHGDFFWNWIDTALGWSRQACYLAAP